MRGRRLAEGVLPLVLLLQAASAGVLINIDWKLAQICWLLIAIQAALRPGAEYVS